MAKQNPQDLPAQYWYGKPGVIEHWVYGVFEGGGAKGVAYSGALLAMKEKKCWFRGVAGASAGAITAALVASGLSPKDMENATDSALKQVQTGIWAGLRRLHNATGYFSSDSLRVWLDNLFREQVAQRIGTKPDPGVTFQQLHDATGIELNLVAADLSLRHQIIFSHIETPNCVVADAVVASSSIPFAFPSRLLQSPEGSNGRKQLYHHTIVDGGVWSNFPMYIFEDGAFREFYEREPREIGPGQILGFLLKEADEQAPPCGEDVRFVEAVAVSEFRAKEWSQDSQKAAHEPSGLGSKIGAWVLYPFSLLGRFVEWNGGVERGRWPAPRSRLVRNLVDSVIGMLGGIHPPLFGLLACAVVVIGAWSVISFFSFDQLNALRATDWTHPLSYIIRPFSVLLTLLAIAVPVLVVFASLVAVVANFLLQRTSRRILYGLVTTYVAGPGAPQWWVRKKKNIIALTVPPSVTTLSFEMRAEERQELIASAQRETLAKLTEILADRSRTA